MNARLLLLVFVLGCQPSAARLAPGLAPPPLAAPSPPPEIAQIVARIDQGLDQAWAEAGVTPAPDADDATYLRRVSLDLAGVAPTAAEARAFLDDPAPDKRHRLVARLLASDDWARRWTDFFDEILMEGRRSQLVDRVAFRKWLYGRLAARAPYDAIVRELVTATGVNSAGVRPDLAGWDLRGDVALPDDVNGAVNWQLRHARAPQDLAGQTSRVFLGVQIQCAECHDHPTERFTQNDFRRLTAAFMRTGARVIDRDAGLRRVEVFEAEEASPQLRRRMRKTGYDDEAPRALDGTPLDGYREALAAWMTSENNPWFARAIVNRTWAAFLGRGFVHPVDDFREESPVTAPAVLEALTEDFVASGHDLRRLHRVIVSTRAYQRSAVGAGEPRAWHRFRLRPMSDDQLLDAVVRAAAIEPVIEEIAGERLERVKIRLRQSFRFTFDVDEASPDDAATTTIPQALMLLNGPLATAGSTALEGSTVARAAAMEPAAAIEELYLAALSRRPTLAERAHWLEYLTAAPGDDDMRSSQRGPLGRAIRNRRIEHEHAAAYEDIFWALLNSSELYFIH